MPHATPTVLTSAPRSVLVLRALPGLGDFLCATPALRALRLTLPAATITLLGLPAARPLVARYPHLLDEFLEFPGFPGLSPGPVDVTALPGFLRAVQGRYDLALQLHGSGAISNIFAQLLGARALAGFYAPPAACPDPTTFPRYPADLPEPRIWLALLAALGVPAAGEHLEFPLQGAQPDATALLRAAGLATGPLALLHVGASEPARRLAPHIFAQIADALAARGLQIALTGAADEAPLAAAVQAHARRPLHDLTGRTALGTLGALVQRARLLIASDTGVSHLASALGTPSVVVFLASDPRRWAPLDRSRHRIVDATATPPTAAAILAEADILLATPRPNPPPPAASAPRPNPRLPAALTSHPAPRPVPLDLPAAARVLVVPPAGPPAELQPALTRLRAALPHATLFLLNLLNSSDYNSTINSNSNTSIGEILRGSIQGCCDSAHLRDLLERLTAARLDLALVFTADHESAFEAAYLAYLAAVPVRAGIAGEFGGAVLSPCISPPPRPLFGAARHLFLLDQLGLLTPESRFKQQCDDSAS